MPSDVDAAVLEIGWIEKWLRSLRSSLASLNRVKSCWMIGDSSITSLVCRVAGLSCSKRDQKSEARRRIVTRIVNSN